VDHYGCGWVFGEGVYGVMVPSELGVLGTILVGRSNFHRVIGICMSILNT
jgi:hypothetical protein